MSRPPGSLLTERASPRVNSPKARRPALPSRFGTPLIATAQRRREEALRELVEAASRIALSQQ